ncbi:6-phosphogluconate dehydrogenase [Methylomarinovum caldicuralii]|uniref:6-phosphogluconate dehydrogenase, decarboxylating n=1 Tax=Methylomarinovum caldicuralii TaxID=438856 RepID=A0AAU9CFX9_9GAMM|nr:NADP-dependent phosphogluconate dehydrogenase [Methylomarinovum caldicuralii]BCX81890.1 6-phosphogluconate dehydrogenase [Methylomarinovum caldicuralii]
MADIGVLGLGVMGRNLSLNLADHGYVTAVFNRHPEVTDRFLAECRQREPSWTWLQGFHELEAFVNAIERPRRIVLLVKAGDPTDLTIDNLLPFLDPGDILIDCGNAHWLDTIRRERELRRQEILFVGSGISGGETGARFGPSLMAGGSLEAWKRIEPVWLDIAAKVDPKTGDPIEGAAPGKPVREGEPCAAWVGENGAGHYVKMVHNGIEYIDMQLIAESYWLLKHLGGFDNPTLADIFARWNQGDLASYLIAITAEILRQPDPAGKGYLIDKILDAAGQKGTGKWAATSALDLGVPANALAEAVFARFLAALVEQRHQASRVLNGPQPLQATDPDALTRQLERCLYSAKICAYAQGFQLMQAAQEKYGWHFDFATIARIWRGGCIIRARFLNRIAAAFDTSPDLANLLLAGDFRRVLSEDHAAWRRSVADAVLSGLPVPALSSALAYYDSYRSERLPANLIQAQRDYFGAHTYERVDRPRGAFFHFDWHGSRQEIYSD